MSSPFDPWKDQKCFQRLLLRRLLDFRAVPIVPSSGKPACRRQANLPIGSVALIGRGGAISGNTLGTPTPSPRMFLGVLILEDLQP